MMDENVKQQASYAYEQVDVLRRRMDTQEKLLPGQYLKGRIRTDRTAPTSPSDVQTPDQLGDIVRTGGYEYIVVNDSGTLKWARITSDLSWGASQISVMMNPAFATANLTSVKTITSTNTFAVYVGAAPKQITTATLRNRVTTAMATITWGEVALATGSINIGGNPTLTVKGWANVSATFNSIGQKSTTINVSSGQTINRGDNVWVLIGNQATTALAVRAQSIADDLQVGFQGTRATRPSLVVGTGEAYTIEGAATTAPWVSLVLP